MATWENKAFRVMPEIREAFESLMGRRGEQMYAISAAMLWYISASKRERLDFENVVRSIEQKLTDVEEGAAELRMVYARKDEEEDRRTTEVIEDLAAKAEELGMLLDRIRSRVDTEQAARELDDAARRAEEERRDKRPRRRSG